MQPILILINNQPVQIGCQLPESITQFSINLNLFIRPQEILIRKCNENKALSFI